MQPHRPHQKGTDEDFGIRPDKAAEYARRKGEDHAGRPAGDKVVGAGDGLREHGVGSTGGHPGKGSGGDVDVDLLGLEPPAPGRIGEPGRTPDGKPNIGGDHSVKGHTHFSGPDAERLGEADASQSGGGVSNNRGRETDDSFASEVNFDEATGDDQRNGG